MEINHQKYLKNKANELNNLLKKYHPSFIAIEKCKKDLLSVDTNNLPKIKQILLTLTGHYMSLVSITKKLQALKRNKENAYFYAKKIEIENEGKKFTSAPIEREATLFVAEERRVRNIFEGYLEACLEGIRTCRAFLNTKDEFSQ